MKNIKTEKLNTAIGGISDKHIEAVGALRNNASVKQKRTRFWSVQYTGIAAAMLVLVVGTLLMFRFLTPDDIIEPPVATHEVTSPIYYVERNENAKSEDYYPAITLYPDGNFKFRVNIWAGIGYVYGTYEWVENAYIFMVTERDFHGFTGDDVYEFAMYLMLDADALVYEGAQIGMTENGAVFYFSEEPPIESKQLLEELSQIVDNLNVGVTGAGVLEWQVSENFRNGTNNPIKISWEQLSVYCEGKYVPDELSNGLGGTDYYQNEEYLTAQSPHLRYIAISDLYAIYNELFSKNAEDIVFAPGINEPSSNGLSHAYGDYVQVMHHGAGAFPIMIPTGHVFDGNTVTLTYATVAIGGAFNGFSNDIITFYDGNIVGSVQYESYQDIFDGNFEYQLFPEVASDNYAVLMKIDYTFILEDGKYKIHSITLNSAGNADYPDGVRDELLVNVELSSILHESFFQNKTAITVPTNNNSSKTEIIFYGSININYFAFCEGYIQDGKIYLDELIFDVSYFSLEDYYIEYKPSVFTNDRVRVVAVREQNADWFDLKFYILLFDSHDMAYFNETDEVVFVPFPLGMVEENNEEVPLANGAMLTFETDEQYDWQTALFVVYDNGEREHIASMTSPRYEVSRDRTRIAFMLSDYRTDHGELYIFDVMSRETIRIDTGDDIGKGILWLDDEVLLYIAGFAAGTVSQGGAVYQYNINDGTSHIIIDYREISKIEIDGDYLNYTICVIFNNAMSYLRYTESVSLIQVHALIANNGYITPSVQQID
jgi:hypothetical protein